MKVIKNITKVSCAALLLIFAITGCKESAELSIDPIERDTLITFTPTHGYPGTTVLIQGQGLNDVTNVGFGTVEGEILSKSATEIQAIVPVGALSAKIKLARTTSVTTSLTDFIVDPSPVPTIMSFAPAIAGSGDTVTISGSMLNMVDSIYIGNLEAAAMWNKTATSVKFKCPVGLQTAKIKLYYTYTTSYGMNKAAYTESSNNLSLSLPSISGYSADIAALDVNQVFKIRGKMLNEVTSVKFGTLTDPTFTVSGDSVLNVTVPVGATTGSITLTHIDGTTTGGTFTVNLPVITSFLPDKGASQATDRSFIIQGTKLDLTTSILVGTTTTNIQTKTATQILFTVNGNASGFISLVAPNGTVKSAVPFIQTGNFWLADFDNMFTPVRLFNEPMYTGAGGSESFQDVAANTKSIGNNGDAHSNFRRFNVTFNAAAASPRVYIRGDQGGSANPAPDRYLLYTSSSVGVNFDFDISWDLIPASMVVNGNVDLKVMFFNADQTAGGGYGYYSGHILVPYTGPGVWQHVSLNTNTTRVGASDFMYNTSVPTATTPKFNPSNCRIICIMFQSAYGVTTLGGEQMTVNYDNVKFTIN